MEKCSLCGQEIQPKSQLNDLRKVVMAYKLMSGFKKDDKSWDRVYFKIYIPIAKKLIEFLGSWQWAADCIQDTMEAIKDWNPEANITLQKILINHAANWKKSRQEKEQVNGIRNSESNGISSINTGTDNSNPNRGEKF